MDDSVFVTRPSLPPLEEYMDEIKEIWDSHWLSNMGVKHEAFKESLRDYLHVPFVELFVNGHMALELTIQAMKLQGEVITTPFTFASTTHAIVRCGLKPVFCDIDPQTYTMDASKIESLITDKTSAIIPVHVYGNICSVDEIERIAKKYELKVIYDAAHAFGETYYGRSVGDFGDAAVFSFHATKVFHSIEGGGVVCHDKELEHELYLLKNFGISGYDEVAGIGANAKMNEFCAAMGQCNLRHLTEEIAKRKKIENRYRERLENISGIKLNIIQKGLERNYAYFPIVIDETVFGASRAEVFEKLDKNGIHARKYFYPLTNMFNCYYGQFCADHTPAALKISKRVLTLPVYADLSLETADRICDIILSCQNLDSAGMSGEG